MFNDNKKLMDIIISRLDFIEEQLDNVIQLLSRQLRPIGVVIKQIGHFNRSQSSQSSQSQKGATMITGIQAGAATPSVFESDPIPSNIPFPAGTVDTWTTSDPLVTVSPSTTNPLQVLVSTPSTNVNTSFTLSLSTQMPAVNGVSPSPLTASVVVPIIAAPAPVPTGVTINQVS